MSYDPDFRKAAARTFERLGLPPDRPTPRLTRGDVASRRQGVNFIKAVLALDSSDHADIEETEYTIAGFQQGEITLHAFRQSETQPSSLKPAVLYIHGGGMIFGSPQLFAPVTRADVAATGVAHFSIDYRLAPEASHPTPVEDCYAAIVWLSENSQKLGIDPARIGVVGLSAGGGLAAATALLARDRDLQPPIAKQILHCPMLDDRNIVTDPDLLPLMTWSWDDNWTGWNALLGNIAGDTSVSPYAAPARAEDLKGLPETYIDIGSWDIFAEEAHTYAERLKAASVKVEWNLYKGVPHGFEFRGLGSKILEVALSKRHAAIRGI